MPATTKPKGLAKIWREITRPFRQMCGSHVEVKSNKTARLSAWDSPLNIEPEGLKKLYDQLVANTDELSREVAARFIARRLFYAESGDGSIWDVLSKVLRFMYPLDYADQERINALGGTCDSPYKFPKGSTSPAHMAIHYGLNQFPSEIQQNFAGKDIIDGGGFLGDSAVVFTEYNPKKVYVFEPNPDTLPAMKHVLEENSVALGTRKNLIEIVPLALGRSKGTLTLHSNGETDGTATTLPYACTTNVHEVDVISIDEFVEAQALNVGLIKLDVEGAEYDTILGAKGTILKQKPPLIISIYHTFKDFFEIKPLIESWGVGYKFEIRHHNPLASDSEFVLMAY